MTSGDGFRLLQKHLWNPARGTYLSTMRLFGRNFDWRITGRWMVLSVLIGIGGAIGALLLATLVKGVTGLFMGDLVGYAMRMPGGAFGSAKANGVLSSSWAWQPA